MLRRTQAKAKLVRWPVEEAAEIAAVAKRVKWPPSARSYVTGRGACVGLMSGSGGTRVFSQSKEISDVVRRVNLALTRWADQHAPKGFGWTSLQMNVNTSSEWHYDHKNEGPSLLLVVGDHLGGEFECQGMQPAKLDGEVALIDGQQWHRNHAAWEGDRISFVAFTNSMQTEASEEMFAELGRLGFRRPSQAYLRHWKRQVGYGSRTRSEQRTEEGDACRTRSMSEPVRKGAQTSYKVRGKKQR